ncbi:MAG: PadR family transcriptional regulator [Actinomycetota bacterium]
MAHFNSRFTPAQGCLLLLLKEKPSHGYELMQRYPTLGLEKIDAGGMYRMLRTFEREGSVTSTTSHSRVGPKRRVYEITPEGEGLLRGWVGSVGELSGLMEGWLARYETLSKPRGNLMSELFEHYGNFSKTRGRLLEDLFARGH